MFNQKTIKKISLLLVVFSIVFTSCSHPEDKGKTLLNNVERNNAKADSLKQKDIEAIFKDLKLPIYDKATFKNVDYKKDRIVAFYSVPDKSEKTYDKVASFYDSVLSKNFSNNNYKSLNNGGTGFFVQKKNKPLFAIVNGTGLGTKNIITYIFYLDTYDKIFGIK